MRPIRSTVESSAVPEEFLCPSLLAAMGMLGKRWNGLIVQAIGRGAHHFADIRRAVSGISDAVLARRLVELQEWGLVESASDSRGAYTLTERGADLVPVLDSLTSWAERWIAPTLGDTTTPVHPSTRENAHS